MSLLRLTDVSIAFGEKPLLDKVELKIDSKERIFLIGRNGMGKSTLLKVLAGHLNIDEGQIYRHPTLRLGELAQSLPIDQTATVYDVVAEGLEEVGAHLKRYHHLVAHVPEEQTEWLNELATLQNKIEALNGWHFQQQIETVLNQLDLKADNYISELSGGWQRRVSLARALVAEPNVLLLDEPTNHLDIEAILWLENYLLNFPGTLICITHDRSLLQRLAEKIVELDRGKLSVWPGDYQRYLEARAHQLEVEQRQAQLFDKKLAQEEVWLRQGVKARRTRNEGRVRALEQLRRERAERRQLQGRPQFKANEAQASGNLVIKLEHIHFYYGERALVRDFSLKVFKKDKIALIGPNGVGKSTFLKLLLGGLAPQQGTVKCGTQLDISYFDQHRSALDLEATAMGNVAEGRDFVMVNGKERHVLSYLNDFLFTAERARTPVKMLSGGECNRLLLAKLFSKPNNLLVLDEPTNDLDIESLELLEDLLVNYQGTILLVSHDRTFVDNIATSTLLFEGNGIISEHVGGYQDIPLDLRNRVASASEASHRHAPAVAKPPVKSAEVSSKAPGLDHKQQHELNKIPDLINRLERDIQALEDKMAEPEFYSQPPTVIDTTTYKLAKLENELKGVYARWETLEALK